MMRTRRSISCVALLVVLAMPVAADSIVVDGVTHDEVLIRESDSRYYVQNPVDGTVLVVSKDAVEPGDVVLDSSGDARDQMHKAWRLERGLGEKTSFELQLETRRLALEYPDAAITGAARVQDSQRVPIIIRREDERSDGRVRNIKLVDVPLGAALDAVLRPLGLDYQVEEHYVYVSSPERLRHEPNERIETRTFAYTDRSATLPKIVVQNPAGAGAAARGGGAGGGGGGARGGGLGGGGGGGGAGGGRGGGTQILNISELFSTIDDTLVGEAPAQIGISISGSGRGF